LGVSDEASERLAAILDLKTMKEELFKEKEGEGDGSEESVSIDETADPIDKILEELRFEKEGDEKREELRKFLESNKEFLKDSKLIEKINLIKDMFGIDMLLQQPWLLKMDYNILIMGKNYMEENRARLTPREIMNAQALLYGLVPIGITADFSSKALGIEKKQENILDVIKRMSSST